MSFFRMLSTPSLIASTSNFYPFPKTLQTIRWRRKPRWLPTAKSKLYKIPPRPQLSEEEKIELLRLHNNYKTQIKSIRRFLTQKHNISFLPSSNIQQLTENFEKDFAKCSEINDKWNSEVKIMREQRIAKELEHDIEIAKRRLEERQRVEKLKLEIAESVVHSEKEASKNFITPDKLDSAIEYAINNPVDYNFAIDMEGNKIIGRETKPTDIKINEAMLKENKSNQKTVTN